MADLDFAAYGAQAVGVLLATSLVVLAVQDWRWTIFAMGVQYAAVFVLVAASWRLEMAVVKLVAGWMATAILAATQGAGEGDEVERGQPSGGVFRMLFGGMTAMALFSVSPEVGAWFQAQGVEFQLWQVAGGLLLAGIGVAILGLTTRPLRVALGLLVMFSGFELLYALVERSALVAGLLALVNLAFAVVGSYLHVASTLEREEEAG